MILIFTISFANSEVYKCQEEGKVVFQQVPCLIVTENECDENYDYLARASSTKASFDDKYCYYRQLDRENEQERALHLKEYQQIRDEALVSAMREGLSKKVN